MFVHHVFFWLKSGLRKSDKDRFKDGLDSLATIAIVRFAHIGVPARTKRDVIDRSYSYSLLLQFENETHQAIYQAHPTHRKFVEDCSSLWEKVIVYDSIDK